MGACQVNTQSVNPLRGLTSCQLRTGSFRLMSIASYTGVVFRTTSFQDLKVVDKDMFVLHNEHIDMWSNIAVRLPMCSYTLSSRLRLV